MSPDNCLCIDSILGVVFVVLKLCHVIDWSWWWVTAPFWGPLALIAVLYFLASVFVRLAQGWAWITKEEEAR